jgi:hypothetical protein
MKTILDNLNRPIHVIDNAFSQAFHEYLYDFVSNSFFKIGGQDGPAPLDTRSHLYLTSEYSMDDVKRLGILDELNKLESWKPYKDLELARTSVNLSVPSDQNYFHTHKDQIALIYYVNIRWQPEWAGSTHFYNEDLSEIIYASVYKPRRLIIFDGEIPHSITVQSTSAPHYRFSLAMFFNKK